jgi:hypothetical protein
LTVWLGWAIGYIWMYIQAGNEFLMQGSNRKHAVFLRQAELTLTNPQLGRTVSGLSGDYPHLR